MDTTVSKKNSAIKKLLTSILAVVMVCALSPLSAYAAGEHTITINNASGQAQTTHTYQAYQVFAGTWVAGENGAAGQLQGITWGTGVNGDALLTAIKADSTLSTIFVNATDAPTAAAAMSGLNAEQTEALAKIIAANTTSTFTTSADGQVTVPGDGYYFIKDATEEANMPAGETYSKYILQCVGDTTVTAKNTTTTSKKQVKDTNDTTGTESDWQNTADYDIGDAVPFKLTGTVASDYDSYNSYYFAFTDTYNKEQLADPQSVTVAIDGKTITEGYTFKVTDTGFQVVFDNLKTTAAKAGSVITVEYTSVLQTTATVGSAGNINSSHIEFSNNPNSDQKGKTPDDNVIVFTYQLNVNKFNESKQALTGATFKLSKKMPDNTYKEVATIDGASSSTFSFKGIDDGTYKLEETAAPAGYNTMDPIEFTVTSVKDDTGKTLTSINGITSTGTIDLGTQQATVNTPDGTISTDVVDKSGSTLPSTGGMGITFLIGGGAALAIIAIAGLSYRRRKNAQN